MFISIEKKTLSKISGSDPCLGNGLIDWALKKGAIQRITDFVTELILRLLASKTSGKTRVNFYLVGI